MARMKNTCWTRAHFASLTLVILALAALVVPSHAATTAAQRKAYAVKATKIVDQYRPVWASISTDVFWWDNNRSLMERRKAAGLKPNDESRRKAMRDTRRPGWNKRVPLTEETKRTKAHIFQTMLRARTLLRQLRSITPVPQSLKQVNTNFTKFSRESEIALNALQLTLKKDDRNAAMLAREKLNGTGEYYNKAVLAM